MKQLLALLHSEVVGVYGSLNTLIGALVVLNVVTLTPAQIAAVIIIANTVLAPIVRGLVTPTAIRQPAKAAPPVELEQGRARVALLLVVVLAAAAVGACNSDHSLSSALRDVAHPAHTVLFSDSFNGSTLDKTKWNDTWGGSDPSHGVNGSEDDCYASSQVNVGGGQLTLTATKKSCLGTNWTSGLVDTDGKFSFTTGTFKARVCLQGASTIDDWPGIWTDGQHWPNDGEIDLLEGLHGSGEWHVHSTKPTVGGGFLTPGCHHVKYVRTVSTVSFFYDGVDQGSASTASFASSPHYLVLNLAVASSISPPEQFAQLHVDWVQVTS